MVDSVYMTLADEISTAAVSTRDRLLESARSILAEHGVAGIGLRAIARHAGVSHGAPLRHFDSLGSLLAALAAEGHRRLYDEVEAAVAKLGAGATARDRLVASGRAYVRTALADPGVYAVMFRPDLIDADDPVCIEAGLDSFGQLVDHVAAAQAEGWQADADTNDLAVVTWSLVHGLCELWLHGPVGSDPRGIEPYVELALGSHVAPST